MKKGYIKLYRKIEDNWLWRDKPFTKGQAWIDILLECNHKPAKVNIKNEIIMCDTGEILNSLETWATRWGWNKSKVRRFIDLLKSDTMVELKPTRKTTHLKVLNYDTYAGKRNSDETQMKLKRNTDETQMTLNKNDKNVKNEKNIYVPPCDLDEFQNYGLEYAKKYFSFPIDKDKLLPPLHNSYEYWFDNNGREWIKAKRKNWKRTVESKVRTLNKRIKSYETEQPICSLR